MLYPIPNWTGYFLFIDGETIEIYSSWGRGVPQKHKRNIPTYKLSQRVNRSGYVRVDLNIGKNERKQLFLHRLIAETLIPNPNNLECVDHIDGNKLNNHPSNLQWITRGDNVRKAQTMGKWGTPPKKYSITNNSGNTFIIENISEFSRIHNYMATKLVAISKGRRKSHKDIVSVIEITD